VKILELIPLFLIQMLSKFRVRHYKSLFDTEVILEPLTVFIGPNGSGKSNICEALAVVSDFFHRLVINVGNGQPILSLFADSIRVLSDTPQSLESKFWHGDLNNLYFEFFTSAEDVLPIDSNRKNLIINLDYNRKVIEIEFNSSALSHTDALQLHHKLSQIGYINSSLANDLKKLKIYDFAPIELSKNIPSKTIKSSGQGIAYDLVDILHTNRAGFDELEQRFTQLVPNIKSISLPRGDNQTFLLELIDKYSEHHIPATDISDGTLRILAFLTVLYQEDTPSIICFEELENGVHPWLLHKMMELLKIVSTEGINSKPVQILITTHSPVLLNYVEPNQVRAVELDKEGKTQIHSLPVDSIRFQNALEAFDGALGELWFTNVFGGNPI
jgi:predicted ATPase